MKKTITCILLTAGLTGYLSAQTPVQDKSDKNSGKVIRMDKQMFLDNIFDGSPDKPGGLSIQLCKSEKKEFYIRYSS